VREKMRRALLETFKELVPYISDEETDMGEIVGPEDFDEDFGSYITLQISWISLSLSTLV